MYRLSYPSATFGIVVDLRLMRSRRTGRIRPFGVIVDAAPIGRKLIGKVAAYELARYRARTGEDAIYVGEITE